MHELLTPPFNGQLIIQKEKKIKRELQEHGDGLSVRIAILGGATTAPIREVLELFLLDGGITPQFYESEYNKWYEDAVFPNEMLDAFCPQIVLIHTAIQNIVDPPSLADTIKTAEEKAEKTAERFTQVWQALQEKYNAAIIQDNFCLPVERELGNLSATAANGKVRFVQSLNQRLSQLITERHGVYIHDVCYLSARLGLREWTDEQAYFLYKMSISFTALPYYCHSVAQTVKAIYGKVKKCLVLDLDNTLWGGVIGEDGVCGIQLGHETAAGEAFWQFQHYVLRLKERGVILAVCSKNDEVVARTGFAHPDSVLRTEDFAAFIANWEPKYVNIMNIANELHIGIESMVFLDDYIAEREIVRENLREVTVPEVMAGDPTSYICALEDGMYFETVGISEDDKTRAQAYQSNQLRVQLENTSASYEEFLKGLEMQAEIAPFTQIYVGRIAQLTNKTNQFNLTTRRYTRSEIEHMMADKSYLTICCRLRDKFGDNGIISLLIGHREGEELGIQLWLMSCRVLKRRVEEVMFEALVRKARFLKIKRLRGFYYKTQKNGLVADLYKRLGFQAANYDETEWIYPITDNLLPQDLPIEVSYDEHFFVS